MLLVRKMFLPSTTVLGSIGSLKMTVTAAFAGTWPTELADGTNSRPSTPGGPGIGSSQPAPVVNATWLSPEAVPIGLFSMFCRKFSAGSLEPAAKSGTSTRICAPASNPIAFAPPVSVRRGSNSITLPEIRNAPGGRVWNVPPLRILIDWSLTDSGRTVVLKIIRTTRLRGTALSPSVGSTRTSASSLGSYEAGLPPAGLHAASTARKPSSRAPTLERKRVLGPFMTTPS